MTRLPAGAAVVVSTDQCALLRLAVPEIRRWFALHGLPLGPLEPLLCEVEAAGRERVPVPISDGGSPRLPGGDSQPSAPERWLSTDEVAALLGLTPRAVRYQAASHRLLLGAERPDERSAWRFAASSVERFKAERDKARRSA